MVRKLSPSRVANQASNGKYILLRNRFFRRKLAAGRLAEGDGLSGTPGRNSKKTDVGIAPFRMAAIGTG